MSDSDKLKDTVLEYRKAKEAADDKVNKAVENRRQSQQEQAAQSTHRY